MKSPAYKGTGDEMLGHLSWSMGGHYRLDGTYAIRDAYSKSPPDTPHDAWAQNAKFVTSTKLAFLVTGWDDGHVTFDPVDKAYVGAVRTPSGVFHYLAVPGEAGIPAATPTEMESLRDKKLRMGIPPSEKQKHPEDVESGKAK